MQNIHVGRYSDPKSHGWAGWLEPEDRSWIAFIGLDGRPVFFLNRDPETGSILGDDPAERAKDLAELARHRAEVGPEPALHTGVTMPAEFDAARLPAPGEPVFPLGISGSGVDIEPRRG